MTRLIYAAAIVLLAASIAVAASRTINRSDIAAGNQATLELGCSWDRNTGAVMAWGHYGSGQAFTMELLTPQLVPNGTKLTLIFAPADMEMGEKPLSYVRVDYQTTSPKC